MPIQTKSRHKLKDQFHHCIPRFILRQFLSEPQRSLTCRERTISFRKALKEGTEDQLEQVLVYDLPSGALQSRPVAKIYGRKNLYRDPNNPGDADHLEHKFCDIEQHAAHVIKSISQSTVNRGGFILSRNDLATLRKFIFLMHFRNDAVSATYFKETDPNNAPLVDWILNYKRKRNLKTDHEVWLDALDYYLKTPHHIIVAAGERLRERYGNYRMHEMLRERLDPELEEEWYAIDYEYMANYFFLGVWEAAEGTEFVLGGNTFGLWEGLIYNSPGAHRLYVVSPRIAIVLRRTFLQLPHSKDPSILYSNLADVAIHRPEIKYANQDLLKTLEDEDEDIARDLFNAYRGSSVAGEDKFSFKTTTLTKAQTYAVNEVVMMNANLHPEGRLTFSSRTAMLETVQEYMLSHNTFLGGKRALFRPLLQELSIADGVDSPSTSSLDSPWGGETDADLQLLMLLKFTLTNGVSFPSSYNRAYLIYHMSTDISSLSNSVSNKIRSTTQAGISKLKLILDPPLPRLDGKSQTSDTSPRQLLQTLPKEESELFFALVGHQVDQLEVGGYNNDMLANIIYEASIIGIAYWLAQHRLDVLIDLTEFFVPGLV